MTSTSNLTQVWRDDDDPAMLLSDVAAMGMDLWGLWGKQLSLIKTHEALTSLTPDVLVSFQVCSIGPPLSDSLRLVPVGDSKRG